MMFLLFNLIGATISELGLAPLVVELVKIVDVVLFSLGVIG